jgi:hypothetical protein
VSHPLHQIGTPVPFGRRGRTPAPGLCASPRCRALPVPAGRGDGRLSTAVSPFRPEGWHYTVALIALLSLLAFALLPLWWPK